MANGSELVWNPDTQKLEIKSVANRALDLRDRIGEIIANGKTWPQVTKGVPSMTTGFLPPVLVAPVKDFRTDPSQIKTDSGGDFVTTDKLYLNKLGEYEFIDWRGYSITNKQKTLENNGTLHNVATTQRFNESVSLPKIKSGSTDYKSLNTTPYSTRDFYLLFNDNNTDYFKHGLQIIDGLNPIENPLGADGGAGGASNMRASQFRGTPFENNDPVMFGFEIIIDVVGSPLFNGSVLDFLNAYSNVSEIRSKIPVYEDFKHQFVKLFKTNAELRIDSDVTMISKNASNYANTDNQKNLYQSGKKAYMGYYLKKVGGLANLVESNTSETKKYLVDYRKDLIDLEFTEDVSLSIATLAHLYKLLYWSKPNGKSLVPENLLRFNCDIIVSECRNFTRVRKAIDGSNIEVIKDNVSRHIYSLKECQLFFNSMPHNSDIDMGNINTYDTYSVKFDYKYSTSKFERFVPTLNGFGQYNGYDAGAIWKIGNPGERTNRGTQSNSGFDTSIPSFRTVNGSSRGTKYLYNKNGIDKALVLEFFGKVPSNEPVVTNLERPQVLTDEVPEVASIDELKANSAKSSSNAAELKKIQDEMDMITDAPKDVYNTGISDSQFLEYVNTLENSNKGGKSLSQIISAETGVNSKNFIDRLKEKTIKNAKVQIADLVNGRINLLSRTINKVMTGFVGHKGISPPQNVYKGAQSPMGLALSNYGDRFFYDIRNELADFVGGSLSNFLNSASYKKR